MEGEEESDLIDEVENVNDLYDVVAEAELKKLEDDLGGEELEMVNTVWPYNDTMWPYWSIIKSSWWQNFPQMLGDYYLGFFEKYNF